MLNLHNKNNEVIIFAYNILYFKEQFNTHDSIWFPSPPCEGFESGVSTSPVINRIKTQRSDLSTITEPVSKEPKVLLGSIFSYKNLLVLTPTNSAFPLTEFYFSRIMPKMTIEYSYTHYDDNDSSMLSALHVVSNFYNNL